MEVPDVRILRGRSGDVPLMSWENTLKKQEFGGLFVKAELYLELSRESMRYFFAKLSAIFAKSFFKDV